MVAWAYGGYPRSHIPLFSFSSRFTFSPGYHFIECCSSARLSYHVILISLVSYVWKSTTGPTSFRQTIILGQTRNFGRLSYGWIHLVKRAREGFFSRSISSSQWRWLLALPITPHVDSVKMMRRSALQSLSDWTRLSVSLTHVHVELQLMPMVYMVWCANVLQEKSPGP